MKFATKLIQHCPPHRNFVATLPREIRNPNLLSKKLFKFIESQRSTSFKVFDV